MPLRPELYRRLTRHFGEVLISGEGEEMVATVEPDALTNKPRLIVDHSGEYYRVPCLFCNDQRHRLWINHRWGLWDPQTHGLNLWLCICYNEDCLNTYERQLALYNTVFDDTVQGNADVVLFGARPRAGVGVADLPEVVHPLHRLRDDHPAREYLKSRGYDPDLLGRVLGVSYCVDGGVKYPGARGRIIIPVWQGGQFVGWQGRLIGEPPDKQ